MKTLVLDCVANLQQHGWVPGACHANRQCNVLQAHKPLGVINPHIPICAPDATHDKSSC